MENQQLQFAYRTSEGVFLKRGFNSSSNDVLSKKLDPRTNLCRAMSFSNNGKMLAYCDSQRLVCVDTSNGNEIFDHPLAKVTKIMFSPDDQLMVTYEPYVIYGSRVDGEGNTRKPDPNLNFFDCTNGKLITTLIQKNQNAWQPMFTEDGKTFVLVEGSEVRFYDSTDPARFKRKGVIRGIENLKVSPGQDPILSAFVPSKNQTNLISLRNFHGELAVICQKSTFTADKCDFQWNSKGNACIATAIVEVDKSNQSYYGTNHVFLLTKMGNGMSVPLSKNGPVHAIQWNPNGNQFAICYGFMPSKVSIFNLKASVVWDMGESHKNEIYYNPFGTILATCGFGNIAAGKIQLWDTDKREEIVSLEVPSTTYFEWAPDGQHFMTSTLSPRLRIDNNYRVWTYCGEEVCEELMVEKAETGTVKQIELAQTIFQPAPGTYSPFKIKVVSEAEKKKMSQKRQPTEQHPLNQMKKAGVVTNSAVYVPPALRKAAGNQNTSNAQTKPVEQPKPPGKEVPETEKKINNLRKKLADIEALKQRAQKGAKLEKNQLEKIGTFDKLKQELDSILSA